MQISIKKSMKKLVFFIILALTLSSCKKETDFVYEVNDVQVIKKIPSSVKSMFANYIKFTTKLITIRL
jgi:PBP1b-binding outer membrane lipoprotein LpoB